MQLWRSLIQALDKFMIFSILNTSVTVLFRTISQPCNVTIIIFGRCLVTLLL